MKALLLLLAISVNVYAEPVQLLLMDLPESYSRAVSGNTDTNIPAGEPHVIEVTVDGNGLAMKVTHPDEGLIIQRELKTNTDITVQPDFLHTNTALGCLEATEKTQLQGLLLQLKNLMDSDTNTAKANRSVADLYGKKNEVRQEIAAISCIVSGYN